MILLDTRARSMIVSEQEACMVAGSAIAFSEFGAMRRSGRLSSARPGERWRGALRRHDARI
ncbi:MAG: hypothetical protein U1E14_09860 [Geminicoccaceae bacterium]